MKSDTIKLDSLYRDIRKKSVDLSLSIDSCGLQVEQLRMFPDCIVGIFGLDAEGGCGSVEVTLHRSIPSSSISDARLRYLYGIRTFIEKELGKIHFFKSMPYKCVEIKPTEMTIEIGSFM